MMRATVYSGPGWGWCERVKDLLKKNHYEVEEKPIMEHMTDLKELNGGIAPRTIPQVVIEEELVGGYNDVELKLISLESSRQWLLLKLVPNRMWNEQYRS